jgi:hypothetical protein
MFYNQGGILGTTLGQSHGIVCISANYSKWWGLQQVAAEVLLEPA